MTKTDKKELKDLVKEGTIEALKTSDGQNAIAEALKTEKAKDAIADALTTEKAKDAMLDVFIEGFNEVVLPALEDHHDKINDLKSRFERLEKGRMIS